MEKTLTEVLSTDSQRIHSGIQLRKVLIIDDDEDMRLYLSMIIASTWDDADVVEFDCARQSVAEIGNWSEYDLLILDYVIDPSEGAETGLDWLRQYASTPGFPATIFVSAHGDDRLGEQALALGARSYVAKGEQFSARLVEAIERLPDMQSQRGASQWVLPEDIHPDLGISEADLNKQERVEIQVQQRQTHQCAFIVICPDQMDTLAPAGAAQLLDKLKEDVRQWVADDGARVGWSEQLDDRVHFRVNGVLGEEHVEMISESLRRRVEEQGFDQYGPHLQASVSIGVMLDEVSPATERVAKLFESAVKACEQASAEGGNRVVFRSVEGQAESSCGINREDEDLVEEKELDLTAMIRSGKIGIQFRTALHAEKEAAPPFYLAAPRIELGEAETLSAQQESRLLIAINNSFDMDRLAVIQAQKLLHYDSTHKESRVIIDVSSQSAVRQEFWVWLIQRLRGKVDGVRMILTLSVHDMKKSKLARTAIIEASYRGKFRLGLRGLVDAFRPEQLPEILPFRVLLGDMSGDFSINRCEQTVKLGAYAHQRNMSYVLGGVDSGEKLVCGYAAKADMMQGQLTSEFSRLEVKPVDATFSSGPGRVLWFDSRDPGRQARRLAEVRKRETSRSS